MFRFEDTFGIKTESKTNSKNIITCGKFRVSVICGGIIRIEVQPDGKFCDFPTQAVLNRDFNDCNYTYVKGDRKLEIKTGRATFFINCANGRLEKVMLANGKEITDFSAGNLKGTRRTLDMTFGAVKIGNGIISRKGVALMDDSKTLILCEDGMVKPRKEVLGREKNGTDIYCFAYGNDYKSAVADYYKLTGETPLIPRFALGNWWSRYKAYTQDEYLALMRRFIDEKIPVTVATIDMDWHWTDVKKRFGNEAAEYKKPKNLYIQLTGCYSIPGWTGYSWNTELFPDYKSFLKELHDNNFKVTLNEHPAVGVRFFENMYNDFAQFMGIDASTKKQIEFDITDKKFIEGYFRFIHNKYEDDGVDFWWLDWQQEKQTNIDGLDPLWALNHYHSLNSERNGKRPLILSRFAGYGSHRYPLGFSGDTAVNWDCLKFQPYFTATASNIGYSWWSHDIGGHHFGNRDDELYIRWLQFGVFSPIMRLHSSNNEFLGKEPWKFRSETEYAAKAMLRLRHKMIPYIYTMNRLTQSQGLPLIKPMYYDYPNDDEAYCVPNEYSFGSELIVAPITEKTSAKTGMASAEVWLPEGRFTDIFTGRIYIGGKKLKMYRDTWSIPALAREGAIIPLSSDGETNDWKNPSDMEILLYRGNGSFKMYEDDGETKSYENGAFAETEFILSERQNTLTLDVKPSTGDITVIPENRSYTFTFRDLTDARSCEVIVNNEKQNATVIYNREDGYISVRVENIKPGDYVSVVLENTTVKRNPPKTELIAEFLSKIQGSNDLKVMEYSKCLEEKFNGAIRARGCIKGAINEIMNMQY